MTDGTWEQGGRFDVTSPLRGLLALAWIAIPAWCLYGAMIMGASLFGEEPSRDDIVTGARSLAVAAGVAAGAPLTALLIARFAGNRRAVKVWTVAFVLGLVAAGILLVLRHSYLAQGLPPKPRPTPTLPSGYCVQYSGGSSTCPYG